MYIEEPNNQLKFLVKNNCAICSNINQMKLLQWATHHCCEENHLLCMFGQSFSIFLTLYILKTPCIPLWENKKKEYVNFSFFHTAIQFYVIFNQTYTLHIKPQNNIHLFCGVLWLRFLTIISLAILNAYICCTHAHTKIPNIYLPCFFSTLQYNFKNFVTM